MFLIQNFSLCDNVEIKISWVNKKVLSSEKNAKKILMIIYFVCFFINIHTIFQSKYSVDKDPENCSEFLQTI